MAEDWKAEGVEYQTSAAVAQEATARLIERLHTLEHARSGSRDLGPFVVGALGGIIQVVSETDVAMSDLRTQLLKTFDTVAPQFEMHRTAASAGAAHRAGGRA